MANPQLKQQGEAEHTPLTPARAPKIACEASTATASPARLLQQRLEGMVVSDAGLQSEPHVEKWSPQRRLSMLLFLAAASWCPIGLTAYAVMRAMR
ncbi:MAG: hypothetical protein ACYDD1_19985 [Caulobacteraceae bacterium]